MKSVTYDSSNISEIVKIITKLILTNKQKVTREEDLRNISENFNFNEVMSEVYISLKNIGFDLIKTKFMEKIFYILTSDGKDDNISPSHYGTLALIIALSKEIDENIKINDLKEIFTESWGTDIQFLIQNDYLRKFDELGIVKVTPLGKAVMKNIFKDLNLRDLLNVFEK